MQLWLVILHTIFEMIPISSSWHLAIVGGHELSKTDIYIAHVPAAIVFLCFVMPIGVRIVQQRAWYRLSRWVMCGLVADSVTALMYGVTLIMPHIGMWPYAGTIISIMTLLFVSWRYDHDYTGLLDPTLWGSISVGMVQGVAFIPGVSRLAVTYAVGRLGGWHHDTAFMFSCALVVPLYIAYGIYAYTIEAYTVPDVYHVCMLTLGLVAAYAMLWGTYMMFARGYAWVFAVYLIAFSVATALLGYA